MAKRVRLTDALVESLTSNITFEPRTDNKRQFYWDDKQPGLALMVTERGAHSFVYQYRHQGKPYRLTFKGIRTVAEARKRAAAAAGKVADGSDPMRHDSGSNPQALRAVVADYLRSRPKGYRSGPEMLASFENHARALLARPIESLTRGVTVPVVDQVALNVGRHAANTLARNLNAVGRWYASRTDSFVWPAVPSPLHKEDRRSRDRVLEDHEIASIWHAAERQGYPHGTLVKFLLLTALRRKEAAHLSRAEVAQDCVRLPPERVKTKVAFTLPLSKAAADILRSCPAEGDWFFAGSRDGKPYWNFDRDKKELDRLVNIAHWTLHDLRRTAATLMTRAGVLPHVVEKVLNHVTPGIAGVYQHHNWLEEKRDALERLASLVFDIVGADTPTS
jgi:integrase